MNKKLLILLVAFTTTILGGTVVWRVQGEKARVAKIEAEILKKVTPEELSGLIRNRADPGVKLMTETPETRRAFITGLREHLALAAQARREGLAEDLNFQTNFEYKKNLLLMELYLVRLSEKQGEPYRPADEAIAAVWTDPANETRFSKDMEALRAIQRRGAEVTGMLIPPTIIQGESLEKARTKWATIKIVSDMAKADGEFIEMPELALASKVLEAGILSSDLLKEHWGRKIKATESEIREYLAAHPEYDLNKKRERAQAVLLRVKAGEDLAALAKEMSEHRPTRSKGGLFEDLAKDQIWPEVEAAALSLEVGQIANELVETEMGFHIVKLEEKRVKQGPEDNGIEFSIRHILFQRKFEEPNVRDPNVPPPFMTANEIARMEIERIKRDQFVNEIVGRNPIDLPNDFEV